MDSGSSCEVIYEHYFQKLKPSIRSLRVDSKIPLVGFSGEHSWPLGEVHLEVSMGESPYTRTETLNFVIVRSNSPYNILLGRTIMQKMGIVVSTIHAEVKFYTLRGIGTMFSTYEPNKVEKGRKKIKENVPEATKDSDGFQFRNLLSEIDREFDLDLSQNPKKKVEQEMQGDLHTLNDDDDLLQLDDQIFWQQDNYHGHNEEEETALLFAELDQL
ncbi:reverse transcriptase domain-containing protein [Tanacetum coccineum]